MKRFAGLLVLLFLASPASAQVVEVPIKVEGGDNTIIKVDEIVVFQRDRTLVRKLPFTLHVEPGAEWYEWTWPENVRVKRKPNGALEILAAPKGDLVFEVETVKIDYEQKKTIRTHGIVTLIHGDGAPKPPPKDPPVIPIPTPTSLYFLVVRADGPAAPGFSNIMADPAWEELVKAGHSYKDKTQTEALALKFVLPPGTTLPVVATLRISADGKTSDLVAGPVPLPTTSEGIRQLGGLK